MCYKKSSIAVKVVAAVDPNKLKTDINCFSSCTRGKLVLTESSLRARSISGGSNIIRHRPCPKSLQFNRFRRNVGHHRKPTSKPPSSSNPTDIFEVREVSDCTLILPVILSFKFNLSFLIIGFRDTETPYWSRDSSLNLIGFYSKACRNQWSWIHGLGTLTALSWWWNSKGWHCFVCGDRKWKWRNVHYECKEEANKNHAAFMYPQVKVCWVWSET